MKFTSFFFVSSPPQVPEVSGSVPDVGGSIPEGSVPSVGVDVSAPSVSLDAPGEPTGACLLNRLRASVRARLLVMCL